MKVSKPIALKEVLKIHAPVQRLLCGVIMLAVSAHPSGSCDDVLYSIRVSPLLPVLLVVVVPGQVEIHLIILQDGEHLTPDGMGASIVATRVGGEVAEDNLPISIIRGFKLTPQKGQLTVSIVYVVVDRNCVN
eukprot:TRINITY_DN7215_c0_g1_i4.p1 TRINITY_DN7215_c0_g1~~TRINITY_DN7215_c0_g1_i4.p1  ORF type:complete len:133 (+),score=17.94 TRINITY_DN7215_c0_g1_i4:126-524(+)